MRDTAQRGFDAPQYDRSWVFDPSPDEVGIGDCGPIGAFGIHSAGRVVIHATRFAKRCGIGNHRIDHASGHTPKEAWKTQTCEIAGIIHIGLGDDAGLIACANQLVTDERNTTVGAVDIGIPTDQNDIKAFPSKLFKFFGGGWYKHALIIP